LGQPGQLAGGGDAQKGIGLIVADGAPLQVGGGDNGVKARAAVGVAMERDKTAIPRGRQDQSRPVVSTES
jgi:hypothetical protein